MRLATLTVAICEFLRQRVAIRTVRPLSMYIFIDESGSFAKANKRGSWNVVAAYMTPETELMRMRYALSELKRVAGVDQEKEVKLRDLSEIHYATFLAYLSQLEGVLFVAATDAAKSGISDIVQHRNNQAASITKHVHLMQHESGKRAVLELSDKVQRLSPQLYIQLQCQVRLMYSERIGRIREKSRGAGAHYDIDVIVDDSGAKARAVTWERRPLAGTMITHPGVYCLRTNVQDWDQEALWRTYTSLTDVESVFRSLKSELGLRPIFHRTQGRCDGHLFITVIAYQMVQTIRRRLGEQGECASWASLRAILDGQQRVTATFRRKDGRTLHVRKATRAEPEQKKISRAPGTDPAPGWPSNPMIV